MIDMEVVLTRYVRMRRTMGFKYKTQERLLEKFVAFLHAKQATYITSKLAHEWAIGSSGLSYCRAMHLSYVRCFSRYVAQIDPRTEIPPLRLIRSPPGRGRARPHIYTRSEIARLMKAAAALPPRDGLRDLTYQCLIGLLIVTGMRISELRNLKSEDVDLKEGVLTIRGAKFGKTRLIPLHQSSRRALARYAHQRDSHFGRQCSLYFLVNEHGRQLKKSPVSAAFLQLSRQIGLREKHSRSGPRIHDFRHSFAVETLLKWYRDGDNVESRLPQLSTFLGHTDVNNTYWYLSITPELMHRAASLLQRRWEEHS
jgi:integrase